MIYLKEFRTTIISPIFFMALLLSGCGFSGSGEKYPADWPRLAKKNSSTGCPDLRGTYYFDEVDNWRDSEKFIKTLTLLSSFLGEGVRNDENVPLRSLTIEGDAKTMLTATFSRQRKAGITDWFGFSEKQTVTQRRGVEYDCDGGWMVGVKKNDMSNRAVSFNRDIEGVLVGRTNVREKLVISVWAETGAGIPYGFETKTYWEHWTPTVQSSLPIDVMRPQKLKRIESQAHDLEYGADLAPRP